jgi:hypothetical protein
MVTETVVAETTPCYPFTGFLLDHLFHQLNDLARSFPLALRLLLHHRDDRPERTAIGKNG